MRSVTALHKVHRAMALTFVVSVIAATVTTSGVASAAGANASDSHITEDLDEVARVEALAAEVSQWPSVPNETVVVHGYEVELAGLMNLMTIAEEDGITLRESIERYAFQAEFGTVVSALQDSYPDSYAGASADPDNTWIAFKGAIPEAALAALQSVPKDVTTFGNRGYSEAELVETSELYFDRVTDHPDVLAATGGYDIHTGTVEIEAQLVDPADADAADEVRGLVPSVSPTNPSIPMEILILEEVPTLQFASHIRGGGWLRDDDGDPLCTFGFNVFRVGSTQNGISTARHCAEDAPSTRLYGTPGSGTFTRLDRQAMASPGYGDLAWYRRSGHAVNGSKFYNSHSQITEITTSYRSPVVGERLCKYGRITNRTCQDVYKINQEFVSGFDQRKYYKLTITHRSSAKGGDSGGPWFGGSGGSQAVGLTMGTVQYRLFTRDVFTPVHPNLYNSMQVRVRTGPACTC